MRIIGGTHKGRKIEVVKGLPVRPTTDFAKEALFNILNNKIDFENLEVLDLFSGTGNIALEFASRGANVVGVDAHYACVKFLNEIALKLNMKINVTKSDVFKFLAHPSKTYDLIFADPPYELENIKSLYDLIFENKYLNKNGLLVLEHKHTNDFSHLPFFSERRKYGNVNFSFFHFI